MRFGWNAEQSFKRTLWFAYAACLIWAVAYVVIYWYEPFPEFWNNFLANFFLVTAALFAALISSLIWRLYDKSDAPRRIWGFFTLGLWLWVVAELTWSYLNLTQGEVPVGLPDVFWVTAYIPLGLALAWQYQILRQPSARTLWLRIVIALLFLIGFTMLVARWISSAANPLRDVDAIVDSFYPVADLLLAVIALRLAGNFAGGALSRPWLGLLVFTFADLSYAWLNLSGLYTWSVTEGNLYSTVADVTYLIAYLVMGISLLYQWLFLKYGMRSQ